MTTEHFYAPDEPTPDPNPCEALRTAMNVYRTQPDTGLMPAELAATDNICDRVEVFTRDKSDADSHAWRRAAAATKAILRDHSEAVVAEWVRAYASLPSMWT